MTPTTLPNAAATLGGFLRDRRSRLAAETGSARRRTPGLRREEVASRAGVSVTWYTWLEQGRGGPPSAAVLERLARALELDAAGREVLFLLGQQRPPPLQPAASPPVPASVQLVLDALRTSPAYVKTPAWDIVGLNAAAVAVFADYAVLPPGERNVLRRFFADPAVHPRWPDWEADARFALAAFRVDVARAGHCPEAEALMAELRANSADFRRLWAENETRSPWVGRKRFSHGPAGPMTLEYSTFAVDGAEGLSMVVFTPLTAADTAAVEALLARWSANASAGSLAAPSQWSDQRRP